MSQAYPFIYSPPLDSLPLPPGWRWDSGFAIFRGLPKDEETGHFVRIPQHCRCLPYYQLATLPEPYIPDGFPVVYCLHFDPVYVGARQAAQAKRGGVKIDALPKIQEAANYVGAALNVWKRLGEHLECTEEGSPLVATAIEAGCDVTLSGVWLCDSFVAALQLEAIFKALHNNTHVCPTCVNDPHRVQIKLQLRLVKQQERDAGKKPEQIAVAG